MNDAILGKNLIPKFKWTTGQTVAETESGVPAGRWVWKVVILGKDRHGMEITKEEFESIYLIPKPKHYGSEEAANKGAEQFIDQELLPRFTAAFDKVLAKNWGIR